MRHEHQEMVPVWFFVGALLLIYGIIILVIGIKEFSHPAPVVLASYHAAFWGGILLVVLGGFYTAWFWPRRRHPKRVHR
jgi:hypothetical protein